MKKPIFTSIFAPVATSFVLVAVLLAGATPIANAQAYYGNYSTYGVNQPYQSCIDLTVFQSIGSTDAYTDGQVSLLQEFLNQTGYLSGVSGTFDSGTLGAVINYQSAHGIQVTGTVGPQTRAAINAQSCGGSVYGQYPYTQPAYNQYSYPVTNYSKAKLLLDWWHLQQHVCMHYCACRASCADISSTTDCLQQLLLKLFQWLQSLRRSD